MIGRSGERGSGISVLAARHDVDDDDVSVEAVTIRTRILPLLSFHWEELRCWRNGNVG